MGIVLKAFDENLSRTIALKIIRPDVAGDQTALSRFTREARSAASLNHHNIVAVHDINRKLNTPYIVMECVDGLSLAELISRRGALPAILIRDVFKQLLSALDAAHEANIIHRDVKSSNILLATEPEPLAQTDAVNDPVPESRPQKADPVYRVKLADFGLARMLAAHTRLTIGNSVMGTPEYMSPEQARGESNIDRRADLYSAGVVLYEMLTGRTPFRADTSDAFIHQIIHERPAAPRAINKKADPALASLALRLMAKNPDDRLPSAAQALQALESDARIASKETRRRRLRISAIAVLILVSAFSAWRFAHENKDEILNVQIIEKPDQSQEVQINRRSGAWSALPVSLNRANAVTLADLYGDQNETLFVGGTPRADGATLLHLSLLGEELYAYDVAPPSDLNWGEAYKPVGWTCRAFMTADLDGAPGDELIFSSSEWEPDPCVISAFDPRLRKTLRSLRHYGHVAHMKWLKDFFAPGHPAILAWGCNSLLDGPKDRPHDEEYWYADWDTVMVVMILDPLCFDGVAPGLNVNNYDQGALFSEARGIYAYACINAPQRENIRKRTRQGRLASEFPPAIDTANINSVGDSAHTANPDPETAPWQTIHVQNCKGTFHIMFTVDRNLNLQHADKPQGAPERDENYWPQRWVRLIHSGKTLKPLPGVGN